MATQLFTGFPGFLGRELLPRVLSRRPGATALCVVQARFAEQAREALRALEVAHPAVAGRVRLVTGDITQPMLGLGPGALPADVREIHHLAAVYDLGVERELALR